MSLKLFGGFCPISNGTYPENQTCKNNSGLHVSLNYPLKGTFPQIIALCVSAHFTSRSCTHDGKKKRCSFCISPGRGDAEFSKGADELCLSWQGNKNKLSCLARERRREEFLMARGTAVQDQTELVECVQEGIGGAKRGQNLELARWQQSLTPWQGSQETKLADRGWERKEDRKGLIIQSWLTVA